MRYYKAKGTEIALLGSFDSIARIFGELRTYDAIRKGKLIACNENGEIIKSEFDQRKVLQMFQL